MSSSTPISGTRSLGLGQWRIIGLVVLKQAARAVYPALSAQFILHACFNQDGSNPTYSLNAPGGYCSLIVRDPISGGVTATRTQYATPWAKPSMKIVTVGKFIPPHVATMPDLE